MKRILALILCCLMVFSLAACGDSEDGNNKGNGGNNNNGGAISGEVTDTRLSNKHVNESQKLEMFVEEGKTITPNGELPDNEEDVDYVDVNYYFNEAINAVIQLDEENMKLYLDEEECAAILRIKGNKEALALWQHTVGNMTFMPSLRAWYGRPMNLVYALWYQDQIQNNKTIPDNVAQLSYDDLVDIYNEYYDKVPLVVENCSSYEDFYIQDGYIKFEMGSPMMLLGLSDLSELLDEDMYYGDREGSKRNDFLHELVMGWTPHQEEWVDFEYIREDGEYVLLDALLALDIDAAEAIIDSAENPWEDEDDAEDYNTYIKTPAAKEAFKNYLKDYVQVYRTHDEVYMLFRIDTNVNFGQYRYLINNESTEAERELLKSAVYYEMDDAMCHENLGTQFRYTFGEILEHAIDADIFENIDFTQQ